MALPQTLRDLLDTIVSRLPWSEESQQLRARDQINDIFAEEEPVESSRVESGVKDADGAPVVFPPVQ